MDAVKRGNVAVEPRSKAETDIANLGYSTDDVVACLASLHENEFNDCSPVTLSARDGRSKRSYADSYVTEFKGPTGEVDRLYVKFRVVATWLTVHSFHLSTK